MEDNFFDCIEDCEGCDQPSEVNTDNENEMEDDASVYANLRNNLDTAMKALEEIEFSSDDDSEENYIVKTPKPKYSSTSTAHSIPGGFGFSGYDQNIQNEYIAMLDDKFRHAFCEEIEPRFLPFDHDQRVLQAAGIYKSVNINSHANVFGGSVQEIDTDDAEEMEEYQEEDSLPGVAVNQISQTVHDTTSSSGISEKDHVIHTHPPHSVTWHLNSIGEGTKYGDKKSLCKSAFTSEVLPSLYKKDKVSETEEATGSYKMPSYWYSEFYGDDISSVKVVPEPKPTICSKFKSLNLVTSEDESRNRTVDFTKENLIINSFGSERPKYLTEELTPNECESENLSSLEESDWNSGNGSQVLKGIDKDEALILDESNSVSIQEVGKDSSTLLADEFYFPDQSGNCSPTTSKVVSKSFEELKREYDSEKPKSKGPPCWKLLRSCSRKSKSKRKTREYLAENRNPDSES